MSGGSNFDIVDSDFVGEVDMRWRFPKVTLVLMRVPR